MDRGLKFRIKKVGGLHYLSNENKGADQLRGYREADLRLCFRISDMQKGRLSHDEAHILVAQLAKYENRYCIGSVKTMVQGSLCFATHHEKKQHIFRRRGSFR